mmetsp:Transcript_33009/g.109044  ORF Transcript_33009/g.109044 Transcript_33009/m.109044 type:complete len:212 (-) Transcript_33009:460-1095(-)
MLAKVRIRPTGMAADMAAAGCLAVAADTLCQKVIEERERIDWRRAGALAAFNGLYVGGFLHVLYQCYSPVVSAVATRMAASSALRSTASPQHALGCAVVDNLHCGSLYIPAFFACVGTMQGQTLGEALALLQGEWWPTYTSCTAFWIPFMAANFRMVAPARRVQAMAVANMFWNVVIDYLAHRQLHAPPSPDRPALLFRTEQPKTVVWPLC